jgi:hypothetical protein
MSLRPIPKELQRKLSIINDDESLTKNCYGTDFSIKVLMLKPVVAFEHTRFRQIIDIAEKR